MYEQLILMPNKRQNVVSSRDWKGRNRVLSQSFIPVGLQLDSGSKS